MSTQQILAADVSTIDPWAYGISVLCSVGFNSTPALSVILEYFLAPLLILFLIFPVNSKEVEQLKRRCVAFISIFPVADLSQGTEEALCM